MNKRKELLIDHITSLLTYDELNGFLPLDNIKVFFLALFLLDKYFDAMFTDKPNKEDLKLQNIIYYVLDSLMVFEQEEKRLTSLSYSLKACLNVC